MTQFQIKTVTF